MTFTLGFRNTSYGSYTWMDSEQVHDQVYEEVQQSISDQGSDGYDLDWGRPYDDEWFDALSENEKMQETQEAHQRGIDAATVPVFNDVMATFRDVLDGVDTEAEFVLPGGIGIYLREELDAEDIAYERAQGIWNDQGRGGL